MRIVFSNGEELGSYHVDKIEIQYDENDDLSVVFTLNNGSKLILDDEVCEAISVEL